MPKPRKCLRPSEIIAQQAEEIEDLTHIVSVLRDELKRQGVRVPDGYADWMDRRTPQELAFVGALYAAYPKVVTRDSLLEILPGYDIEERSHSGVSVAASRCRAGMGRGMIETVHGVGYRLTEAGFQKAAGKSVDALSDTQ